MSRKFWIALAAAALVLGGIALLSLVRSDSIGDDIADDTTVDTPPVRDLGSQIDGMDDAEDFDQDYDD